ncbi:unnamed protein product [Schistosoma margrebowiei]|uniref:Uncharacterized protein n=1 Tax=Schistosoma margrebowiei TaxID=48269 RepID=A0A3P8CPM1_9TREM|nr:unnamed protein product [Schistosoma margrebowiei]
MEVVNRKPWTRVSCYFGTRQQGVAVILRELVLPDGFDLVSPSFTVRDVTPGLSGPRPTSCRSEM